MHKKAIFSLFFAHNCKLFLIYNKLKKYFGRSFMREKTIILSSLDGSDKKAVLYIEAARDGFCGNLRLYNFKEEIKGILTLGFLSSGKVLKAALTNSGRENYSFEFDSDNSFEEFSCALVLVSGGKASPILFGSTNKNESLPAQLSKHFDLLDETNLSAEEVKKRLDEDGIDFCPEDKEEIERVINANLQCADKCASCNYRNAFYGAPRQPQPGEEVPLYPKPEIEKTSFYDEIKGQLSLLFERYPEETFLNEIIPNSKWVKVDYEDNGQYFVIGLLYEEGKVAYVCYGMPGEFTTAPPRELSGISQWLPLDPEKPNELGYWIMYQDAETGENVEIKIS